MFPPPLFFPEVRLNFTENMLADRDPSKVAIHACIEGGQEMQDITWGTLRSQTERIADAMVVSGIRAGDRVAGVVSNRLETMLACLATLSIGALWSTSSPDMGVKGILDRLLQIRPKLVFAESSVLYNGKVRDLMAKNREWAKRMLETPEFQNVIVTPRVGDRSPRDEANLKLVSWDSFLSRGTGRELQYQHMPFSHPGFIVYSSGTVF
jgi:acetoacetyl-CoA synthetase